MSPFRIQIGCDSVTGRGIRILRELVSEFGRLQRPHLQSDKGQCRCRADAAFECPELIDFSGNSRQRKRTQAGSAVCNLVDGRDYHLEHHLAVRTYVLPGDGVAPHILQQDGAARFLNRFAELSVHVLRTLFLEKNIEHDDRRATFGEPRDESCVEYARPIDNIRGQAQTIDRPLVHVDDGHIGRGRTRAPGLVENGKPYIPVQADAPRRKVEQCAYRCDKDGSGNCPSIPRIQRTLSESPHLLFRVPDHFEALSSISTPRLTISQPSRRTTRRSMAKYCPIGASR